MPPGSDLISRKAESGSLRFLDVGKEDKIAQKSPVLGRGALPQNQMTGKAKQSKTEAKNSKSHSFPNDNYPMLSKVGNPFCWGH